MTNKEAKTGDKPNEKVEEQVSENSGDVVETTVDPVAVHEERITRLESIVRELRQKVLGKGS